MDQRAKGGAPPTTTSPAEDSDQDQVAEKRRRVEGENPDVGAKEERRGTARKREGDKGAVLELLIEGRCGAAGQQQHLQISGQETSCSEGNVRLRIGLQAKRTKKPPKILESYVCKPTIRTYQRQGKGGVLKGGDGEGGQQSRSSSIPDEAIRENRSGLDAVQITSKQTASAPSPPLVSSPLSSAPSSSSQPPALSSTSTAPTPASDAAGQGTKIAKQVPVKLANKTEPKSNGSSDRVKKEKLPNVNGQHVHKPCSPTIDKSSSASPQYLSAMESTHEEETFKNHNGLVETKKKKVLANGKSSADNFGGKTKAGKHSGSSSLSSADSTRPPSSYKELSMSQKSQPDRPRSPSVSPKPQYTQELSSVQSRHQDPSTQPSQEKKREKDRKGKKERRKEKKSKRDKMEAERVRSNKRKEEGKRKKKEKWKDGKARHVKEKSDRELLDNMWRDELKIEREKAEKSKDKFGPEGQRNQDGPAKCGETGVTGETGETGETGKLDRTVKELNAGRAEESDKAHDVSEAPQQAEIATSGDASKPNDVSSHPAVPPNSSSAPPSLPASSAHAPFSPTSSPQEQDSRPLKKRKARRPSWTRLVHRAHRAENQDAPSDPQHLPKTPPPAKTTRTTDGFHPAPPGSTPLSSTTKPSSPTQNHSTPSPLVSKCPVTPVRKRGRPKSQTSGLREPPIRFPSNAIPNAADEAQKAPVLESSPTLEPRAQLKKRGRPPKRPVPEDRRGDALRRTDPDDRREDVYPSEKGNRQLKIRRLINEMKKRKKRRLHKAMLSGYVCKGGPRGKGAGREASLKTCKSIEATAVHSLTALSSSFGGKLGPQINVSKRGTIYMGKRRGRKPKAQTAHLNSNSQSFSQASLFTHPVETSLFLSNQPQPAPSHPFPSPSLTHSSGAQSPYSEGSLAEPTSSQLFSHPFSLPSPSSSCTSPRPLSSSSLSPFVKKSCPCQGRHHFPFHQSTCKLSCPTPPLHPLPGSPGHLKEATPSPRSESHSEDTLPSDSGIGTDNNSVSERGEMRGVRGLFRLGQASGGILGGQKHSLMDRSCPVSSPLSLMPRHINPISNSAALERHRHRHRRRDYNCSTSCACMCPCPCPAHNKCTHSDYYSCLGHNALKRQKNKHKKKHQQHMQDPEFVSELEDLIAQFSEVHIGRRSWARTGLGQGFDGSGNAAGARRHHPAHSHRSNIFRINLNGFYSPHPPSYPASPSFPTQSFYSCQPVHCNRKPDRRQCGCPSKFQETIENMGFYSSYPPATALYHHLPSSYPLPPSHQYAPHQPHHAHFFLNPARFHRRRGRLLRDGALGGEMSGDLGSPHLGSGYTPSLSCDCGRGEHKHKQRHRQCGRDMEEEEELHDEEEEDGREREGLPASKSRARFVLGQGGGGRKGMRGMSKGSPWLGENGKDSFSAVSSSAERFKHSSLSSLGLGSSHLSSFGGGWGGLGQGWTKLGGAGFATSRWKTFTGDQHAGRTTDRVDDGGEEDIDEVRTHAAAAAPSPAHTNLFTSAAIATRGCGLRSGLASRNPGSGERLWRRDEPAWTERREAVTTALQGDSKSRGLQKSVPTLTSVEVKNKRRPGRPRKHPLPSASPPHSSAAAVSPASPPPDLLPGCRHGRAEERGSDRGRGEGDSLQQATELELQARRKRGRKRKHGDFPCHQSAGGKPECDVHSERLSQSEVEQDVSPPAAVQREERADGPPRKTFLKAGLYSDDYKTADPPSHLQLFYKEREDSAGEREYSLLPAPIHVGKYLRLKRIHFQLPYDVMWLWRHKQLHRQPAVPLKRKRRYCRLKERTTSSHQSAEESSRDICSIFPHLDMEPLTSSERSFVVKHHVFLVRNWELVRDRQIRLKMERRRPGRSGDDRDSQCLSCDGASGDDSHIKSGP